MTDIVERLRDPSTVRSWADADEQRDEAADEIERLRAEVESLTSEIDARDATQPFIDAAHEEVKALRADAARYRWLLGGAPEHSARWRRWELRRWDGECWHSLERSALDAALDADMEKDA
jgi:hypothetical protein